MTVADIEDYYGTMNLALATLAALIAGDPEAVAVGLSRMSMAELVQVAESSGKFSRMAVALVNGDDPAEEN